MTGLFGTLNTSTSGMRAQQVALQTTSHNLTNMNTPGYSRQRVTMSTAFPQSMAGIGQLGTGVQISGVIRVSDEYIVGQLQNELSALTQHENISEVMGQLEAIFNEPSDSGISQQISDFFVSWGNLGSSSDMKTSKTMVLQQSQTFMDTVNHLANQIDKLGKDTVKQITQEVKDFNAVTEQLKTLNDQIFNATVKGEHPNDLYDSQDRLVGQLKDIAGVNVEKRDNYGRIMISLDKPNNAGTVEVVTAAGVEKIAQNTDDINDIKFTVGNVKESVVMNQGSIQGFLKATNSVIGKGKELDNFIGKFATAVNFIMQAGKDADGNYEEKGIPFFDNLESAKTIKVNQSLINNPEKLIAGDSFDEPIAGDGLRAKAISDLQNIALDFSSTQDLDDFKEEIKVNFDMNSLTIKNQTDGAKIFNHYNDIITDLGITKQQADNMVANQTDLVSLLEQRHESVSGVDLNEEVVDMIRYQSAYQANARVISAINDMLDTLINRMGV